MKMIAIYVVSMYDLNKDLLNPFESKEHVSKF